MGSQVTFESFSVEQETEYRRHLAAGDVLVFATSVAKLDEAQNWLKVTGLSDTAAAVIGKLDQGNDALIITSKIEGEVNKDFSKDIHISKLAEMKSKLQPPRQ